MSASRPGRTAPAWDPPLTVSLLVVGLVYVTQIVAAARDLPGYLDTTYALAGVNHAGHAPATAGIGYAIVVVQMLSLVVAIAVSVRRIREHRAAFWVPVVTGVVCTAVSIGLFVLAVALDPVALPTTP